ncbi:hypothetical protein SAMN04489712_105383 [Thermomonospora echinospora]|uniref:O-antigen ligase like membrane protein n=2 Tax=Thermomonospora echinospora TaxID=1992 RepID=A0A1H6AE74_9ACTN|nr:hypothetical protein SAMN04489712_105383 [Thermomonospora echinospora]
MPGAVPHFGRTGRRPGPIGALRARLGPGWPLTVIFIGFPVWWLLGLGAIIFLLMTVPMALHLWRHRDRVVVPRGFGWWLFFLAWVMLGVGTLWADAPGAVLGGGAGRLFVFLWRMSWYLAATVVLLFIGNLSERDLPTRRVADLLALMFIFTTAGGLVGSFLPNLELTSPMELVLPNALAKNAFVYDWIHPKVASIETILGFEQARPQAPFGYANVWGSAYAFFLPFFIITWLIQGGRWRRVTGTLILAISLWPVVYSLNRGLWLSLGLMSAFVIGKILMSGNVRAVRRTLAALTVGALLFAASPLPGLIQARLDNPHSNNRRGLLAEQTVRSALTGSPIVGFGSTRDVQGNFASVAGGDRPGCRACGVPPMGTQGHIWLLVFATGVGGTVSFIAFFVVRFARHWRERSHYGIAGCAILLCFGQFLFTYDLVEIPLFTVMVSTALTWRARRTADAAPGGRPGSDAEATAAIALGPAAAEPAR